MFKDVGARLNMQESSSRLGRTTLTVSARNAHPSRMVPLAHRLLDVLNLEATTIHVELRPRNAVLRSLFGHTCVVTAVCDLEERL